MKMKYPICLGKIYVPQKRYLKGSHFFNMTLEDPLLPKKTDVKDCPWDNKLDTWMVSCPPAWIKTGYTGNFYKMSDEDKTFNPRIEILLANFIHDHNIIHRARGTQPFGTYLRGHLNSCRGLDGFAKRTYDFVELHHYYTSDKVSGDFMEQQVYMTYLGLKVLLQEGFIREDFQILCFDKSWPVDKYVVDDAFLTVPVGDIIRFWEETPYAEALTKWRNFAEWGKTYTDERLALSFLNVCNEILAPMGEPTPNLKSQTTRLPL